MSDMGKLTIYMPRETVALLSSDNEMFEVYKPRSTTINRNRFLSMLVQGYYTTYIKERQEKYDQILKALEDAGLKHTQKDSIAASILGNTFIPAHKKRYGKRAEDVPLKPTAKTEPILNRIKERLPPGDSVSSFLCGMFMSYGEKPFSERERIIFRESYDALIESCKRQQPIIFTFKGKDLIHEVIPYAVTNGPEELYNYLLCQEENPITHIQEAKAYRLCRIKDITRNDKTGRIQSRVKNYLERMKKKGPQYSINDDEETCVKLTQDGRDSYRQIYFGRPAFDHEERVSDGFLQYYTCSQNQLELYFRRFGPEAVVVSPLSLREKIADFHRKSLQAYDTQNAEEAVRESKD